MEYCYIMIFLFTCLTKKQHEAEVLFPIGVFQAEHYRAALLGALEFIFRMQG